jgi:hypothetical protein
MRPDAMILAAAGRHAGDELARASIIESLARGEEAHRREQAASPGQCSEDECEETAHEGSRCKRHADLAWYRSQRV